MNIPFVLCIENRDCEDLDKGKVYQQIPDHAAAKDGYVRVVDESGEDYLYPASYFIEIQIPERVQRLLVAA